VIRIITTRYTLVMLAAMLVAAYYRYLLNRFNQVWTSDRIDDRIPLGFQ
jgi:hypothetical protein